MLYINNYNFKASNSIFCKKSKYSCNIILSTLPSQIKNHFLLFTGLVTADNIEPDKEREKNTKETETVKMSCSYSTNSEYIYLYWYRQYPNKEPQYLLRKGARSWSSYYEHTSDDRFQSTTSQTSTELTITDVRLSDSALYYCALRVGAQ
ncbi:T-cell receptor alpha chain V region HPB-MLT [Anabarilius grahami]|nr:T-cell receptor alpha chain V region HPB-MLT [Anabarilius grahami]